MQITGKEYRRRIIPTTVNVITYTTTRVKSDTELLLKVWDKRRCFVCCGKFTNGDPLGLAITDQGNKVVCAKCVDELPESYRSST